MRLKLTSALLLALLVIASAADEDWPAYLGDSASSHYSELKQINHKNVQQLEVAWTYHSGDGRNTRD